MQLANYPAIIAFGAATHRSQLKARTPLARNAGHSAARSVAKALKASKLHQPNDFKYPYVQFT